MSALTWTVYYIGADAAYLVPVSAIVSQSFGLLQILTTPTQPSLIEALSHDHAARALRTVSITDGHRAQMFQGRVTHVEHRVPPFVPVEQWSFIITREP